MLNKACLQIARAMAVSALVFAASLITAYVSYSQTQGWSAPVPLSSDTVKSWFPDVTTDMTGRVHVAWSSMVADYDTVMYTASPDGQVWRPVTDIAAMATTGSATRPDLLVDREGILHFTFRTTTVYYQAFPLESVGTDISRFTPHRFSGGGPSYFSRLALDAHGGLHALYTREVSDPTNLACPFYWRLFYRQSRDNGLYWSTPIDISKSPTGTAKPHMVIDDQGYIYVVWEAGCGGDMGNVPIPSKVMYAASFDGGETWTAPAEFVVPGGGSARNIALGLDGSGKLVVAWLGWPGDVVYYQFSRDRGLSWSPPQQIPGLWGGFSIYGTLLDDYDMAMDSAGLVHLVLVGRTAADQKTLSVLHLTWDGTTWSKPEAISTLSGDVPEWPRIAVGLGNQLHVVWFVRDRAHTWDTSGYYRIWYAHGVAPAPALTPVAWPTHTPTPELGPVKTTPTATPRSAPTPTPTLDPAAASLIVPIGTTDAVYTESDELMLLAKSLIPVALIVAAVIVGVRLRRR
jgi:hypothetical protein